MTIRKLASGNYQIRMEVDKKAYSVTVPYKPTTKEAVDLIYEKVNKNNKEYGEMTFIECANEYMEIKSAVLSPSTKRGYKTIINSIPTWFAKKKITSIEQSHVQKLINDYAKEHSPKSTRNYNGFIQAVFGVFLPKEKFSITLPQKAVNEVYTPTEDDIRKILDWCKENNKKYWVVFSLAILSCRRSEICGCTIDDLSDKDVLFIHCSKVLDENRNWVIKPTPKTSASVRKIPLPNVIAEQIRKQGYIYDGSPASITNYLNVLLPRLGIQRFSLHKMRHFFASYAHQLGYTSEQIKKMGGWDSDIMEQTYRHAMKIDEAQKQVVSDFGSLM